MKKKFLIALCLVLCACDKNNNLSSSTGESDFSVNSESNVSISSDSISSSTNSISSIESSQVSNSSAISSSGTIDSNEKEYYKSLVNRDNIHYSEKLVNDSTHNIKSLEIFQINDTHGAYDETDSYAGIARVSTLIKNLSVDPYAVVKIANGDMMQGTAFSNMLLGEPAVAALNEMDFDCFVIGNHEFDWTLDNLAVYKDGNLANGELDCPFLGANIVDENNQTPSFIQPYTVVEKGNVKVGILGIIGDGLENSISKVSIGNYHFASTIEVVNKYSKILKEEEKVDVIILASHAHNESLNAQYVLNNDIDCIINGHDHQNIEEEVIRYDGKAIPVIESLTKNGSVGKVALALDENKKMKSYSMTHYRPAYYDLDNNLNQIINEYFKVTQAYQSEVIGYTNSFLSRDVLAISTASYIADKYEADLVFVNTGGVRNTISSGEITNAMLYEAFPFDNELYIATLKGSEIKEMIALPFVDGYYYDDNHLGRGYEYDYYGIDVQKDYKVISVDYVVTKDYMSTYFNESHQLVITGDYIRDCAIENIKKNYKKN